MDASERRRRYLRHLGPWIGFVATAAAAVLGTRAIAAGYLGGDIVGYAAGAAELLAGYVIGRRAWDERIDATFVAGLVAVLVLSVATLFFLQLPPTVFEEIGRR